MHLNELKPLDKYLLTLKDEQTERAATMKAERGLTYSDYKSKAFYSLVPLLLQKYPEIRIRDNLNVDRTFAVVFPRYKSFRLLEAVNVYLDLIDTLEEATYAKSKNTGFINLHSSDAKESPDLDGFWVLLD